MGDLSVAEVLNRAADLIEPEGKWVQGSFAKDANGNDVLELSSAAVCWCVRGAVFASYSKEDYFQNWGSLISVIGGSETHDIEDWNDAPERTQAEVVAALRKAATLAQELPPC